MKGKIYIETYGCSANQAESEIMSGLLIDAGYKIIDKMDDSDLVIINTCFVKTQTEQKIFDKIKQIEKKLIIAGCMPEIKQNNLLKLSPNASLVSTHNITKIIEAVENTLDNNQVKYIKKSKEEKLGKTRLRQNKVVGITEISQGCLGSCTYCCVKLAKGKLHCYSPETIVNDVKKSIEEGCNEIWITSQDNSAYNYNETKLPELINKLTSIHGDYIIRIGMMNPNHILDFQDDLINSFKDDKVFKFIHIPVQSGSNNILKSMDRKYTVEEFESVIESFRKLIPNITIATDIIVGFPGETDADFESTIKLLEKIKFDIVNVSKFGIREGTVASKMTQLDNSIIKKRSKIASEIVRKISKENNKKFIGWSGIVAVSEKAKKNNQFMGRNIFYKPVLLESEKNLIGKKVKVKIIKTTDTSLIGKIT